MSTNDPTPDPRKARRVRVVPRGHGSSPRRDVRRAWRHRLRRHTAALQQRRHHPTTQERRHQLPHPPADHPPAATYPPPPEPACAEPKAPRGPPGHKGRPGQARASSTPRSTLAVRRCAATPLQPPGAAEPAPVEFSRDVSGCEATATLASVPGGSVVDPPAGRITVRPNGIRAEVHTYDVDGSASLASVGDRAAAALAFPRKGGSAALPAPIHASGSGIRGPSSRLPA